MGSKKNRNKGKGNDVAVVMPANTTDSGFTRRWGLRAAGGLLGGTILNHFLPDKREFSRDAYFNENDIAVEYANLYDEVSAALDKAKKEGRPFHMILSENHSSASSLAYEAMLFSIAESLGIKQAHYEITADDLDYVKVSQTAHLNPKDTFARIVHHIGKLPGMRLDAIDTFFRSAAHKKDCFNREIPDGVREAITQQVGEPPLRFGYEPANGGANYRIAMSSGEKQAQAFQIATREHLRLNEELDTKRENIMAANIESGPSPSITVIGDHHARNIHGVLSSKANLFHVMTAHAIDAVSPNAPESWKESNRWIMDPANARQPVKSFSPYVDAYNLAIVGMKEAHRKFGTPVPDNILELNVSLKR